MRSLIDAAVLRLGRGAVRQLAVAYEQQGLIDKAREAYEKALALDPDNAFIRQNFDLFKEIHDRVAVVDRG